MKIKEILTEKPVDSSWIADIELEYQDDGTYIVIMTTLNGREYELPGIDKKTYQEWISAGSKGSFWWDRIKDQIS